MQEISNIHYTIIKATMRRQESVLELSQMAVKTDRCYSTDNVFLKMSLYKGWEPQFLHESFYKTEHGFVILKWEMTPKSRKSLYTQNTVCAFSFENTLECSELKINPNLHKFQLKTLSSGRGVELFP